MESHSYTSEALAAQSYTHCHTALFLNDSQVITKLSVHRRHKLQLACQHLLPFFFLNDPATTEIYTLSLHDALPILPVLDAGARASTTTFTERGIGDALIA